MFDTCSFLILGGTGFIGRHLVKYLLDEDTGAKIRVVDKVHPSLAYLNDEHKEAFDNSKIEFVSANLLSQSGIDKAFESNEAFDFVINCAGETRHGMSESIYREGILDLSKNCAKQASVSGAKRFVEISCGTIVSKKNNKSDDEESHSENGTFISNFKQEAEKAISLIPGLKYTILRPAAVYGTGDRNSITPRLIMGAIYRELKETLKFVWGREMMMNTVHVHDLCRAICFVLEKPDTEAQVYNIVDPGNTTQGTVNDIIADIFGIKIKYIANTLTTFFMRDVDEIIEGINETHSTPWAKLCERHKITNTPLSSYLHKEGLANKHLNLDGTKLTSMGFEYKYPKITKKAVEEILNDYKERNLFPMQ